MRLKARCIQYRTLFAIHDRNPASTPSVRPGRAPTDTVTPSRMQSVGIGIALQNRDDNRKKQEKQKMQRDTTVHVEE